MSKLLRANFVRLWKSKVLWICMLFMCGCALLLIYDQYRFKVLADYQPDAFSVLLTGCVYMPVVAAVFIGLFIGTEYSDGTIRNKLIIGHTRYEVYLANFVVTMAALVMMQLVYIIVMIAVGLPVLGGALSSLTAILSDFLISIVSLAALNAVYLLVSMLIHSKSTASVTLIIGGFFMLMAAVVIWARLNEPEYYDAYSFTYVDESGELVEESQERKKNINYLGEGIKRDIYEFIYEFLPSAQMHKVVNGGSLSAVNLVYSCIIMVALTACGVILFRKKDLK